jgi:predicted nuclease of predicted toxin-antitoxin system
VTFVADESVDRQIVEAVRGLGYDVLSIAESAAGISDEDVLSRANDAQSVLLTADKDFGELVFRLRRLHAGIVLFRLAGLAPTAKAQVVAAAIKAHGTELEAEFCVVTGRTVRIRRSRR